MTQKLRKFERGTRVEVERERRERQRAQAVREALPDCAWRIEFPDLGYLYDRAGGKTAKQRDLTRAVKVAQRPRIDPYTGKRVLIDTDPPRRDDLLHPAFLVKRPFDETWDARLTGYNPNIKARSMRDEQTQKSKVKDPRTGWTPRVVKETFESAEPGKVAPSPFDAEPDAGLDRNPELSPAAARSMKYALALADRIERTPAGEYQHRSNYGRFPVVLGPGGVQGDSD